MQARNGWNIVEPEPKEAPKGIVLPETAEQERSDRGTVLSCWNHEDSIIGQKVLFIRYGSEKFTDGDRELYAVKDEDIIAVL